MLSTKKYEILAIWMQKKQLLYVDFNQWEQGEVVNKRNLKWLDKCRKSQVTSLIILK